MHSAFNLEWMSPWFHLNKKKNAESAIRTHYIKIRSQIR